MVERAHAAGGERISDTIDNRCPCGGGIQLCQLSGGNIKKEKAKGIVRSSAFPELEMPAA